MDKGKYTLKAIGRALVKDGCYFVEIDEEYRPALKDLDDFGHIDVVWWADKLDKEEYRNVLTAGKTYVKAPENLGIFATRSPLRPNPVAITVCSLIGIDHEKGLVQLNYLDADDGTPVIDIKPYHPCTDRVRDIKLPEWCEHWPKYYEESGEFDWESEFLF